MLSDTPQVPAENMSVSRRVSDLTILLLTYDGFPLLRRCLESLRQYDTILVIDNGSQGDINGSVAPFSNVRVLRLSPNQGFAGAYNLAMPHVTTPYVAILSNDTLVAGGCLERLVQALERDQTIGIAAPLILNFDGSVQDTGHDLDFFGFPIEAEETGDSWEVFYASGCLLVMRAALYRQVGGFSRHFQFFVEDVDLCWKVWLRGKRVVVVRDSILYHEGGMTLAGASTSSAQNITSLRRTFFRERNVPLVFIQNFSAGQLFMRLPLYAVNSILEAIGMLCTGHATVAGEYVRAWFGAVALLPSTLPARKFVQRSREVSDRRISRFFKMRHRKAELILSRGLPSIRR